MIKFSFPTTPHNRLSMWFYDHFLDGDTEAQKGKWFAQFTQLVSGKAGTKYLRTVWHKRTWPDSRGCLHSTLQYRDYGGNVDWLFKGRKECYVLCLVYLGNMHHGLPQSLIARWGSQSVEQLKEDASGHLYAHKEASVREISLMTCVMGTLGGRAKGDLGVDLWCIGDQRSREESISNWVPGHRNKNTS